MGIENVLITTFRPVRRSFEHARQEIMDAGFIPASSEELIQIAGRLEDDDCEPTFDVAATITMEGKGLLMVVALPALATSSHALSLFFQRRDAAEPDLRLVVEVEAEAVVLVKRQ